MNLGIISQPNTNGQIVIPKKSREELGLDEGTLLQITRQGNGIYIAPLENVSGSADSRELFFEILKKTAGAWSGDDWIKTNTNRKKLELAASKKRKSAW